jgi:hypothetical protein
MTILYMYHKAECSLLCISKEQQFQNKKFHFHSPTQSKTQGIISD